MDVFCLVGKGPVLRIFSRSVSGPLLLMAAVGLLLPVAACDRKKPVDPEEMRVAVGAQAFRFYRALNDGDLREAARFVSERKKAAVDDALDIPLFQDRMRGVYEKAFAERPRVDWRKARAEMDVTLQKVTREAEGGRPAQLKPVRQEAHRWVREDGEWYFDGVVP